MGQDAATTVQAITAVVQAITAVLVGGFTIFLVLYTVHVARRADAAARVVLAEDRVAGAPLLDLQVPVGIHSAAGLVMRLAIVNSSPTPALGVHVSVGAEGEPPEFERACGGIEPGGRFVLDDIPVGDWYDPETFWKPSSIYIESTAWGLRGQRVEQSYTWYPRRTPAPDDEPVMVLDLIEIDPGVPGQEARRLQFT